MRVWVYPERSFEELGAERWQLSWEDVKPSAVGKEDLDPDVDIEYRFANYKSKAAAVKAGRKILDSGNTAFGAASVVRQVVGWFVEEDRVAEWQNTSEEEHLY